MIVGFAAVAVFAGLVVWLSIRYPYRDQKLVDRPWFWNDLVCYAVVQSAALGALIAALVLVVDDRTGWSRLHLVSGWPIAVQVIGFLVAHDLFMYGLHRLTHRLDVMWRLHEAGHSVEDVDLVSGLRSHPFEILINQTIEFGTMVFLGAAPEAIAIKGFLSLAWGIWLHHNIAIRTGWLQYIINGAEMHRWHHHPAHMHTNFSTKFAIWDWLFGTAYLPRDRVCDRYGLDNPEFPGGWLRQSLALFRRVPRSATGLAAGVQSAHAIVDLAARAGDHLRRPHP